MDYSQWLGQDYRSKYKLTQRAPTIVTNHGGPFDIFALGAIFDANITFLAKSEVKKIPLIGFLVQASHGLFVERAKKDEKDLAVETIANR